MGSKNKLQATAVEIMPRGSKSIKTNHGVEIKPQGSKGVVFKLISAIFIFLLLFLFYLYTEFEHVRFVRMWLSSADADATPTDGPPEKSTCPFFVNGPMLLRLCLLGPSLCWKQSQSK